MQTAKLILKNGLTFAGLSPDWQTGPYCGEVVFTTGMTGYIETLTDPSYAGQIVTFTYPSIGNYGVGSAKSWESKKIHASGVVVSQACSGWSHSDGRKSLLTWLKEQKVPIITGVDTRELTKTLRQAGVMPGAITSKNHGPVKDFKDSNQDNLVDRVSIKKIYSYGTAEKKIIAVDCGMKENIMRQLKKLPAVIRRVPHDYDYTKDEFSGIFISNGPGDPVMAKSTIAILKKAMLAKKPIFGICLGSQLMGLAAGAKTYKLPFGHRGQNQPCQDLLTKRCFVTSQNHGYAIKENTISRDWYVNFRNLNDGSVEGIAHKTLPFLSVQFHPEAAPGPTDTGWLFQSFYNLLT